MFTPKTRQIIFIGCVVLGGLCIYLDKGYALIVIIMVVLINLYGYIRQGTVYLAFKQLRQGDHEKAEKTLNLTKKVNWLSKTQKAYYHFVLGYINMARGNTPEAKDGFINAGKIGLRVKNDQALAYANLAMLYQRSGHKEIARGFLDKTKGLKVKKGTEKEIERLRLMIEK